MKTVTLQSGKELAITPAPFADAKSLYQALLADLNAVKIDSKMDTSEFMKQLMCIGFSSPRIEACLWPCLARCTYQGLKIVPETFEPVEARADYLNICLEVTRENVDPFWQALFAAFVQFSSMIEKNQLSM